MGSTPTASTLILFCRWGNTRRVARSIVFSLFLQRSPCCAATPDCATVSTGRRSPIALGHAASRRVLQRLSRRRAGPVARAVRWFWPVRRGLVSGRWGRRCAASPAGPMSRSSGSSSTRSAARSPVWCRAKASWLVTARAGRTSTGPSFGRRPRIAVHAPVLASEPRLAEVLSRARLVYLDADASALHANLERQQARSPGELAWFGRSAILRHDVEQLAADSTMVRASAHEVRPVRPDAALRTARSILKALS